MPRTSHAVPVSILVVTDLDGSLLNEDDYRWEGAAGTLQRLRDRGIPLVMASSKTAAEMAELAEELQLDTPRICENGAAIHWPDGSGSPPQVDRGRILAVLDRLSRSYRFRGFKQLGSSGVAALTGLSLEAAQRAGDRAATEPIVWEGTDPQREDFARQLAAEGLMMIRGGRFWHVSGPHDKADAMRQVVDWYTAGQDRPPQLIAIGDSPNDAGMLSAADYAIMIPDAAGRPKMQLEHPRLRVAPQPGSAGWGIAVASVLDTLSEHVHE